MLLFHNIVTPTCQNRQKQCTEYRNYLQEACEELQHADKTGSGKQGRPEQTNPELPVVQGFVLC